MDFRAIYDGKDISRNINDFRARAVSFPYSAGKYLYIASTLPFNNLYFDLDTTNNVDTTATIQVYYNNNWSGVVDFYDETEALKQSGRMSWSTHYDRGWSIRDRASRIPELSAWEIYQMYWLRISFAANLSSGTKIKYIGQLFSNDEMLYSYYPDLVNMLEGFKDGKENWNEQHYIAADFIVNDLKNRNLISSVAQLLDYDLFGPASCHKVAELIYMSMDRPYDEQRKLARSLYLDAMNMKNFGIDLNNNGRLEPCERGVKTGWLKR